MVRSTKFWGVYKSDTFDYVYNNRVFQFNSHRNTGLAQSSLASKNNCWFSQHLLAQQNFEVPQIGKYELCSWWKLERDGSLHMLEVSSDSSSAAWVQRVQLFLLRGDMESPAPPSNGTPLKDLETKPSDWNVSWEPHLWSYFLLA